MKKTAEFVSPRHPDKMCDYIADMLLDAHLEHDKESRVALEVMGGRSLIVISGEVTSRANLNEDDLVRIVHECTQKEARVILNIEKQSPEISRGVDAGGAGDQGIVRGYATSETKSFLPKEYELARDLNKHIYSIFPYDGKTQVTLRGDIVESVIASFQSAPTETLLGITRDFIRAEEYFINPAGAWNIGGFEADTGLSGRKIVVDNYGPNIPVGGGSYSGKDTTKVDRSGAYMARRIAVELLKKHRAKEVFTQISYAIGKKYPTEATARVDGRTFEIEQMYDLSYEGIQNYLSLDAIRYADTAHWGHYGRDFPWL